MTVPSERQELAQFSRAANLVPKLKPRKLVPALCASRFSRQQASHLQSSSNPKCVADSKTDVK